jgi:hypothetical protein
MMIRTPDSHPAATLCESCGGGVPPGYADPSFGNVRGHTCVRADVALAAILARLAVILGVGGLLAGIPAGCDPTRRAALRVVAGPPSGCPEGAYRCHAGAPETCSASGRWYPILPAALDGSSRVCTGSCRIDPRDGVAACMPIPPDAAPGEGTAEPLPPPRPPGGASGTL